MRFGLLIEIPEVEWPRKSSETTKKCSAGEAEGSVSDGAGKCLIILHDPPRCVYGGLAVAQIHVSM